MVSLAAVVGGFLADEEIAMVTAAQSILFTFRDNGAGNSERQSDGALDQLRTLIITLELEPGSVINEATLSRAMGYGRTPLREAIFRLAEEHLVTILPHRSVVVAPLTLADLQQIFEARLNLECTAARLAAERRTDAQLAAIQERGRSLVSLAESSETAEFYRWAQCHFEFHLMLAKACGNAYLGDGIRRVLPASMRLDFFLFRRGAKGKDRALNHVPIVEALTARAPVAAEEAMRRHIVESKERTLKLL